MYVVQDTYGRIHCSSKAYHNGGSCYSRSFIVLRTNADRVKVVYSLNIMKRDASPSTVLSSYIDFSFGIRLEVEEIVLFEI